jgi:galactose oxidase-like protein
MGEESAAPHRLFPRRIIRMTRRIITVVMASMLLATGMAAAAELPANEWTKIGQNDAGVRRGSAVVWLEKAKKFLVLGGLRQDKWTREAKIPPSSAMLTFDPATRKWEAIKSADADAKGFKGRGVLQKNPQGKLRLNAGAAIGGSCTWDADNQQLYVFANAGDKAFHIYRYDVATAKWSLISTKNPPAKATGRVSGQFGYGSIFMEGTSAVLDPVNQELLFIGGRTANAVDGFVGHWALSLKDKTWRTLTAPDATLDAIRAKVVAAKAAARDAMAAARNVYYATLPAEEEAAALKGRPAVLAAKALKLAQEATAAAKAAKGLPGAQALARLNAATQKLTAAADALKAGAVSTDVLKNQFDAAWTLDTAVDCLRTVPGPRTSAGLGYDRAAKKVVVFGGDHGDYLLNDTWTYDCAAKTWTQHFPAVSPKPRRASGNVLWLPGSGRLALAGGVTYRAKFMYFQRNESARADAWTFDASAGTWSLLNSGVAKKGKGTPSLTCRLAAGAGNVLLGLSHHGRWRRQVAPIYLMRVAKAGGTEDAAKVGCAPMTRVYLSVVKEYNPLWYDAAPRGDPKKVAEWIAKLKPNTWAAVPKAPRPAAQRSWGTSIFDPDRDRWYHWTGGHEADPCSQLSIYYPGINRWTISHLSEHFGKGISFNGRPDCRNHTYLTYAYDTVSKKLICTTMAGTSIYDPDRSEFEPVFPNPFKQHCYVTSLKTTPHGVVCWHPGYFGILDVAGRKWKKLPVKSIDKAKMPWPKTDGTSFTYDSKRDALWFSPFAGYQKPSGQIHRYDMKTGELRTMNPGNRKEIGLGPAFRRRSIRETLYLPDADVILFNNFHHGRQVVYDPTKNTWALTNIKQTVKGLGGVDIGLMWDAKRKLVWAMSGKQKMFVLRLDFAALEVTADVPKPAPKKAK